MILALMGTGLVSGFINTTAGGGSTLALPLLIFLGLPANVANGTNRVAILFQNIIGVRTFHKKKVLDFRSDSRLLIPAVIGSLVGALIAVEINPDVLKKIIGGLMLLMLLLVVLKPEVWINEHAGEVAAKPSVLQYVIFFFIGIYGGFIQMGVGFLLLSGLVLGSGYELVKANAVKVFIVLVYTIFSIGIYMVHDQINWMAGLMLAAGNMAGAWLGVHFAVKGGARYIRYVLILALIIVIVNLFGLF